MHLFFFCKYPTSPSLIVLPWKGTWDFYQIIYCERCDKPQKHGISCWKRGEKIERQKCNRIHHFRLEALALHSRNRRRSIFEVIYCPIDSWDVFKRKLVFFLISIQSILNVVSTEKVAECSKRSLDFVSLSFIFHSVLGINRRCIIVKMLKNSNE